MVILYVWLGILGLAVGSFVNALVWRIHTQKDFVRARSMCPECEHTLAVSDLVPVFSWLWLKGKCRYCHKKIATQYPIVELIGGILFVGAFVHLAPASISGWLLYLLWVIALSVLLAIVVYDLRWMQIPDVFSWVLVGAGLSIWVLDLLQGGNSIGSELNQLLLSLVVSGGFIFTLWGVSRGKWMGFGDVYLGIFLGLTLPPLQAFLGTLLAFYIGAAVAMPFMLAKKVYRLQKIPFAPYLALATAIMFISGDAVEMFFLNILGWPQL